RLQTTASKVSSENERACASSTKTEALERFAEALACLLGHGGGDIGGRNVTGRADRGEGRLRRKPRATTLYPSAKPAGLGPPTPTAQEATSLSAKGACGGDKRHRRLPDAGCQSQLPPKSPLMTGPIDCHRSPLKRCIRICLIG